MISLNGLVNDYCLATVPKVWRKQSKPQLNGTNQSFKQQMGILLMSKIFCTSWDSYKGNNFKQKLQITGLPWDISLIRVWYQDPRPVNSALWEPDSNRAVWLVLRSFASHKRECKLRMHRQQTYFQSIEQSGKIEKNQSNMTINFRIIM